MDEQQRGRIRDDLKGFFKGELLFDVLSRALYSTDASIFQVQPLGVAAPRDEEDVQELVRYAALNNFPLVARGAGTGVAGESLGRGLIVDFSRHFRTIGEVHGNTVQVQPGVTLVALNARLAKEGRRFAPDPASGQVCTIGGMLANNASGSHALLHGYTRDHVAALRVVLDSGEIAHAASEKMPLRPDIAPGHWHDIVSTLALLLEQNGELIRACQPQTRFNRCGYLLDGVYSKDAIDLPRLLVGSEGTLGLFTEATLRTLSLPGGRALVLLGFLSLDLALQAAQKAATTAPIACELMDRRLLSLARGSDAGKVAALVPAAAEAILLVEYEAGTQAEASAAAVALADQLSRVDRLALHAVTGCAGEQYERLWQLREVALPSLYGIKGGAQPVPFVEDIGVPPEQLPEFLRRVQEILQEHETVASFLIHAASGQIHTRPFLDLQKPEDVSRLSAIAEQTHTLALDLKGTISTQHGTGLARTPWVARQYGPLYPIFRQIKAIFDPRGLFNPGKIVDPDASQPAWPLRAVPAAPTAPERWELLWQPGEVRMESTHCNGCGHCRTEAPQQRMCPIFRAVPTEAASPRGKANLLRHLLEDSPDVRRLGTDEVRAVADLCVNCKMCAHECPAHVNIPKLMLEAKAANVAQHGLDRTEWFLARLERFAQWGSALPLVANLAMGSRALRWVFAKVFGLSARRRLPRLARRSFLSRAKRRGWCARPDGARPWLAYFPDLYANYIDPQIGEATVLVLRHQGYDVYVPPEQVGSGIEALAHGDAEAARESARANLRILAELAREGVPIICSEPSAAIMLRQDYLDLIDDPDARLVAHHTVELTTYLGDLLRQGKLRTDFQALVFSVGHHVPCHLKALGNPPFGPALLSLIPQLRVHAIDVSCSGMAGTFGLKTANYDTSLAAGRPMLDELARSGAAYGATECSSCRMQMEDGARKRTLHPVQFLALAYGLLPEIQARLREPIRELVLR
ncbi:MAG TPA: FAD-linked oxidase C-terminal domain-containing protein [Gemmataceae bacterium]|nr:FAD-linked oxidase C-terminal domain-containing protein [Gemmataceae bacterium]